MLETPIDLQLNKYIYFMSIIIIYHLNLLELNFANLNFNNTVATNNSFWWRVPNVDDTTGREQFSCIDTAVGFV